MSSSKRRCALALGLGLFASGVASACSSTDSGLFTPSSSAGSNAGGSEAAVAGRTGSAGAAHAGAATGGAPAHGGAPASGSGGMVDGEAGGGTLGGTAGSGSEVAGGGSGGASGGASGGTSAVGGGGNGGMAGSSAGSAGATSTGALLLISELKTRGAAGGNDEFVELYNPGSVAVSFDSSWLVRARGVLINTCNQGVYTTRFTGKGQTVPAHGHFLIAGAGYAEKVTADGSLSAALTDGGSIVLVHGTQTVDAVCYSYDDASKAEISGCNKYECEGAPLSNLPHTNSGSPTSNVDVSLERKPGASAGNGQDSDDNSADFSTATSSPQNTDSAKVP